MRAHWKKSQKESVRLEEAGLTDDVLDSALSSFILEVVARHGEPSKRLCNKDPFTLKSGAYLQKLFPRGKFLFMVRDGRATVHSIITRKGRPTYDVCSHCSRSGRKLNLSSQQKFHCHVNNHQICSQKMQKLK